MKTNSEKSTGCRCAPAIISILLCVSLGCTERHAQVSVEKPLHTIDLTFHNTSGFEYVYRLTTDTVVFKVALRQPETLSTKVKPDLEAINQFGTIAARIASYDFGRAESARNSLWNISLNIDNHVAFDYMPIEEALAYKSVDSLIHLFFVNSPYIPFLSEKTDAGKLLPLVMPTKSGACNWRNIKYEEENPWTGIFHVEIGSTEITFSKDGSNFSRPLKRYERLVLDRIVAGIEPWVTVDISEEIEDGTSEVFYIDEKEVFRMMLGTDELVPNVNYTAVWRYLNAISPNETDI